MNILLVNGSPRKGNTFAILKQLESHFQEQNHKTEILNLSEFAIKDCIGCYKCVLQGGEVCPLKDDVTSIWQKFLQADGIVLSAPVYALGIPGFFKNYMDRVAYNAHRPEMYNKPMVIVSTTAGMGTENVIQQLKWFEIAGLRTVASKGFLVFPTGVDKAKTAQKKNQQIKKLADALHKALQNKKLRKPTLIQVIQFYGLKLNCTVGKKVYLADFAHFKDRKYHVPVAINPVKRLMGKMVYRIGTKALKSSIQVED